MCAVELWGVSTYLLIASIMMEANNEDVSAELAYGIFAIVQS